MLINMTIEINNFNLMNINENEGIWLEKKMVDLSHLLTETGTLALFLNLYILNCLMMHL